MMTYLGNKLGLERVIGMSLRFSGVNRELSPGDNIDAFELGSVNNK